MKWQCVCAGHDDGRKDVDTEEDGPKSKGLSLASSSGPPGASSPCRLLLHSHSRFSCVCATEDRSASAQQRLETAQKTKSKCCHRMPSPSNHRLDRRVVKSRCSLGLVCKRPLHLDCKHCGSPAAPTATHHTYTHRGGRSKSRRVPALWCSSCSSRPRPRLRTAADSRQQSGRQASMATKKKRSGWDEAMGNIVQPKPTKRSSGASSSLPVVRCIPHASIHACAACLLCVSVPVP